MACCGVVCQAGQRPLTGQFGLSDPDTLDFIQAHLVATAIIELGCPRACMVRHGGIFQRAAVLRSAVIPVAWKV